MKLIPLSQGKHAIVDDEDYSRLSRFKWSAYQASGIFYAIRHMRNPYGKRPAILMHREIIKAPGESQVDHINGDGLDNRKSNLRLCNHSENMRNQHKLRGKSGFRGVTWFKRDGKWYAHIRFEKKLYHLGVFDDELDAALAYDRAAAKYHGEFASLNFPEREVA